MSTKWDGLAVRARIVPDSSAQKIIFGVASDPYACGQPIPACVYYRERPQTPRHTRG
ncbi:unnamed protein product [Penicillium camemberti]|uniref:Str. FM013 n=1 Tax=Penicillium camemberti (strain FM 013) TaxID=1429867 RepID=A0A0G4P2U5_PENC3|nr:unnamed protein product [Penicillium camemberti]